MWYAIVGPGLKGVYKEWSRVAELSKLFPYCSYRKFYTEQECWQFVGTHARSYTDISLTKYGNTFDKFYVQMRYFMKDEYVYYTFMTDHFGKIRLTNTDNCLVEYKAKCITVKYKSDVIYDNELIIDHLNAIVHGVEMLGDFIDVDIIVPNYSIYYALTLYNGVRSDILNLVERLRERMAEFSVTLNNKQRE